ncbi:DUF3159 domain-containing protein [Leucobacter sp. wl10]|uniref:DUF3159 domain-containing protein n=1 Tax=Leucobacter sp. wl10 TaxID=2304677 RepID=UPI000E5A5A2C|nr:DUF3159 domain-containing protein [Leucobacter sp. wl10]RGE19641.1 DUF3159 domain-containing protein [Leucobacter sp. wl10]
MSGERRRAGLGRVVEAGLHGESVSARGLLQAIGGWRGIAETLLPATVYLAVFVFTRDARISAIAPLALAGLSFAWRLIRREPVQAALAGLLGVVVCVGVTLFTGRGEDYYLPGFWINAAWIVAHTVSLLVGWPLIGLLLGFLRGSLTEWRRVPVLRRAATVCTLFWIAAFAARLLVQLPLYFAAQNGDTAATDALGLARLLMGVPLFALAAILTWLVLSRVSAALDRPVEADASSDDSNHGSVENTGRNGSSA